MSIAAFAETYLDELRACLAEVSADELTQVHKVLQTALEQDRAVFVVGNGGSAATACHIASDLCRCRCGSGLPGLRAVSLTDNIAAFTASANDSSYENAFAELLALQLREHDVVIAISGSGNSPNVVRAVLEAKRRGGVTVALVGFGGGELGKVADHKICVNSKHYGAVEDLHLALGHMLSMYLAGGRRIDDPSQRPDSSL